MNQIKTFISQEVEKCLSHFQNKLYKTIDNMEQSETIHDYEFDLTSFSKKCTESIFDQVSTYLEKPKSKKSKKDPNQSKNPKKPRNAYILFSADNRSDVKSENPEMDSKEITKKIAQMWKEADDSVKEEYKEKAMEDKKRYQKEIDSDESSDSSFESKKENKKKEKKDPNLPKKPCSSYILFSSDKRKLAKEENPELNNIELTKKLAEMWKNADKNTKEIYEKKSQEDKKRYDSEMEDYNKSDNSGESEKPKDKESEKPKAKDSEKPKAKESEKPKAKDSEKPKDKLKEVKKSSNPFMNFVTEKRPIVVEENPDCKNHEITKILADLWKDLSEEEKDEYKK